MLISTDRRRSGRRLTTPVSLEALQADSPFFCPNCAEEEEGARERERGGGGGQKGPEARVRSVGAGPAIEGEAHTYLASQHTLQLPGGSRRAYLRQPHHRGCVRRHAVSSPGRVASQFDLSAAWL
eukprot:366485-Chlamydomonas_euryale.AAC.18